MNQNKRLVVANWKMHPSTLVEAKRLFKGVSRRVSKVRGSKIIICPPTLFLSHLIKGYSGTSIIFGAQDSSMEIKEGSFTGEISPTMLKRLGVQYVILGHSERRARGETSEIVALKVQSALLAGLVPILCVGEKDRDDEGRYLNILLQEITDSLKKVSQKNAQRIIIAYEPIWAIGKRASDAMSPDNLHEMALFIKKVLVKLYGRKTGNNIRILYGGSVEPINDDELMQTGVINGFLVGRASLNSEDFLDVVM